MGLKNKTFAFSDNNIKVDIDLSKFENRLNVAQTILDTNILQDTEPYVRYDTGQLNLYSLYNNDRGSGEIIYKAERNGKPYARATYYNTHNAVTRTHHSQATPLWFEISKIQNKNKWINQVKKILGGEYYA
jgi:hypothetical protein